MNEELLKVIRQLKDEVMQILLTYDLTKESEVLKAIDEINALYDKLGVAIESVVPAFILESYLKGTAGALFDASFYAAASISDNTMLDLRAAIRTARMNTNTSIGDVLKDVQKELRKGVLNSEKKRKVTQRVAEAFEKHGMTSFMTVDGKRLPLDFYAEVVTRTNMQSAEVKGTVDWFEANGNDLIIINGVTPTCAHCYAHRGMVFSISGNDPRFPKATDNLPPYHVNCMCYPEDYDEESRWDIQVESDVAQARRFDPGKDTRPDNIREAYDKRQASNRKNNYEKKKYAQMKAKLGNEAPATLGAFKRMKRGKTKRYQELQKKTRDANASTS